MSGEFFTLNFLNCEIQVRIGSINLCKVLQQHTIDNMEIFNQLIRQITLRIWSADERSLFIFANLILLLSTVTSVTGQSLLWMKPTLGGIFEYSNFTM